MLAALCAIARLKLSSGPGHGRQRGARVGPGGLAEDRHPARIAAEPGNVVAHPHHQRGDLVEQPLSADAPSICAPP